MSNRKQVSGKTSLAEMYPAIAEWVQGWGWVELGQNDCSRSMVRVLDDGGMIWEGKEEYETLDKLFSELEKKLAKHMKAVS